MAKKENEYTYSALITDGLWRKSLSAIRSLGKAGFYVSVMGDSIFTTGFWSKFTQKRILAPLASRDAEGFGERLMDVLKRSTDKSRPVLFPMEDASLMWVAENIKRVSTFAYTMLPPLKSLEIAQDKGSTIALAEELGLPCPFTVNPGSFIEFIKYVNEAEPDRTVVKPRVASGSSGVIYGTRLSDEEWEKHWNKYGPLLIQERIPVEGGGLGVAVLMDADGESAAYFVHERHRQYPVSGGPSTDRRSIHDIRLAEWSIKLLERLNWKGIAMVEWKYDVRDHIPKLMEINPRFWGSLELAVRSGVNFPFLYAKVAMGEKLGPPPDYPDGVRCRWMIPGDVLRYLNQSKEDREGLRDFLRGLPYLAEEWDREDIRGTIASIVCPGALVLNPRYWKYLRSRR